MDEAELVITGLLVAVALLGGLANQLGIPYPIVLVVGGAVFGFVPGVPDVHLDPDVVLLVFLPPLLYAAASFADLGDLRSDARSITLSAVGLVLATMCAVAVVSHELVDGLSWAAAFALGAIVSPTDPLAGATIMRRLGAPRRLVALAEGEGLMNDATALVAYRVAVAAVTAGTFSLFDASLEFVLGAIGGVAIGLAVAVVLGEIRQRVTDIPVNITVSLLSGYAAFLPAHAIHASGVLAAVTCGLYMGHRIAPRLHAETRLQSRFIWEILDFLINATLFVIVGLQLPQVIDALDDERVGTLILQGALISLVVTGSRLAWLFTMPYLIRAIDRRPQQLARRVDARARLVVAWAGMRGAVSLAAALALPLTTDADKPFPERDLIIFLTFSVIFSTLVVQGLTLPSVIKWAGICGDRTEDEAELRARRAAVDAALSEIDRLANEDWTREDSVERLRNMYLYRQRRLGARAGEVEDDGYEERSAYWQRMIQRVLAEQRAELLVLRDRGELPNDVMHRIVRELDLEEARLEI